jgi:hypothetical protein
MQQAASGKMESWGSSRSRVTNSFSLLVLGYYLIWTLA